MNNVDDVDIYDVNDKLIEGLQEAKGKVDKLKEQLKEKDLIIQAIKTDQVKYKVDIVNDTFGGDMVADVPKKMIKVGDYHYAFVKDSGDCELWINNDNDNISDNCWGEVSDLTELRVWEYQELKSYAVAVGMVKEHEDLFI